MTVRDPARWHLSVNNTIRQFDKFMCSWLALPIKCLLALKGGGSWVAADYTCTAPTYLGPRYPRGMFGAVDAGEETAVRFFNEWVELVKAEIPAERLLVFEVKQGWGPLCNFLGVPEPEEPFPNMNDTAEQLQRLRAMRRISVLLWTAAVAGLGAAAYYFKDSIKIPTLTFN